MKSKSPFAKKSPLQVQVYGGDTYESPDTVITKTVGVQVGKAITETADKLTNTIFKAKTPKKPETSTSTDSRGGDTNSNTYITNNYGGDNGGSGASKSKSSSSSTKIVKEVLPYVTGYQGEKMSDAKWNALSSEERRRLNKAAGANKKGEIGHDGYRILKINEQKNSLASNPLNKLMEDTMDTYGQTNENDLTGIADPSQAQTLGNRDFRFNQDPIAPGRLGSASSVNTQNQIFGGGQAQTAAEQLQTPLYDKGHANDYDGHTHRKKGGSYKVGDYMDETDMETSYPKLHTQDVGEIKKDKKSQYMVSKNEDYNPTKIDTIRPLKGKTFKMGWGDAERNISTNPKYKKSK